MQFARRRSKKSEKGNVLAFAAEHRHLMNGAGLDEISYEKHKEAFISCAF